MMIDYFLVTPVKLLYGKIIKGILADLHQLGTYSWDMLNLSPRMPLSVAEILVDV